MEFGFSLSHDASLDVEKGGEFDSWGCDWLTSARMRDEPTTLSRYDKIVDAVAVAVELETKIRCP